MILRGSLYSEVLGMDTGITVAAPNGTKSSGAYKVCYLLHGLCGNHDTWTDYAMLPFYAAKGNTVYVMPDAARSFYADMKLGAAWFTYLTDELPELCRSVFHISACREDTAVIGGSMGGYGALKCAMTRPERYGMCAAFSAPCLFLNEGLDAQRLHGKEPEFIARLGEQVLRDFELAFGPDLEHSDDDDLPSLAGKLSQELAPQLFLTCGARDAYLRDHRRFCSVLDALKLRYTYEQWGADHSFPYFSEALRRAINYFAL